MLRAAAFVLSSALLAAIPAGAQQAEKTGQGNPAGMKPGSPEIAPGKPGPHVTNDTDRLFSRIVAMGGMAEVEFAKLVEKRSHDPAVERFASRMIEDHGKANEQLASLAKAGDIPLSKSLDPEHEATRSK